MNENEDFIPGLDELDDEEVETPTQIINFNVNDANIAKAKEAFKDVDAYQNIEAAKEAKKILTKMRTTLAAGHQEAKAKSLAFGRRLDAEKNRLLAAIGEIEDPIKKDLDDIKNKAVRVEEERIAGIMEHIERLQSYSLDRHDLNLEQIQERRRNLAAEVIEEERYQEHLGDARMAAEEADTKLRIVLQRETEADEERERQAKVAEENKRVADELAERQAEMDRKDAERKKAQDEIDEAARLKQKVEDDEKQTEFDRVAAEQDAERKRLDEEREEREAKERAEEERLAALARAPDREKLEVFCKNIQFVVDAKPTMESQEGSNTMLFACGQLTELLETVRKCIGEMK